MATKTRVSKKVREALLNSANLEEYSKAFAVEQVAQHDEKPVHMGGGYEQDEIGAKDGFRDRYVGKFYGSGNSANEVLSMGMQYLFQDPIAFWKESPEHFRYTLAAIHGLI